jgi:hypothetical protein
MEQFCLGGWRLTAEEVQTPLCPGRRPWTGCRAPENLAEGLGGWRDGQRREEEEEEKGPVKISVPKRVYPACLPPWMGVGKADRQASPSIFKPLELKFLYSVATEEVGEAFL